MIAQLIYARILYPCSKSKTASTVFPRLYHGVPISEDQVYDGCAFIGESYKKYIELFNHCYEDHYKRDFSSTSLTAQTTTLKLTFRRMISKKVLLRKTGMNRSLARLCFWMQIWFHLPCRCILETSQRNPISGRSYRR